MPFSLGTCTKLENNGNGLTHRSYFGVFGSRIARANPDKHNRRGGSESNPRIDAARTLLPGRPGETRVFWASQAEGAGFGGGWGWDESEDERWRLIGSIWRSTSTRKCGIR